MIYPISSNALKIKNAKKRKPKYFSSFSIISIFANHSKINKRHKSKKQNRKIPISGQEKANNKVHLRLLKYFSHIGYKYYHIFADMNAIKRNIPNIITLANLTCGLFAIIFAFQGNLTTSFLCIFAGAFFDFFDGLAARF